MLNNKGIDTVLFYTGITSKCTLLLGYDYKKVHYSSVCTFRWMYK